MIEIGVTIQGFKEVEGSIKELGRQLPFAVAKSLTLTAKAVKERNILEMETVFDRPTPYTLNSLFLKPATKTDLRSEVFMKDAMSKGPAAVSWLGPEIFGGDRNLKRSEVAFQFRGILPRGMYAMPGAGAEIDRYGNMNRGQIIKLLSYFRAFGEQGYRANITDKRKAAMARGTKKKRGLSYFALKKKHGRLQPGIYSTTSFGFGKAIKPILIFTKKPQYKPRFHFYKVGEETVNKQWPIIINASINEEIQRIINK